MIRTHESKHGPSLITYIKLNLFTGMAIGVGFVGILCDFVKPVRLLAWPMLLCVFPPVIYLYRGYLPEKRLPVVFDCQKFQQQRSIFVLGLLFSALAVISTYFSLFYEAYIFRFCIFLFFFVNGLFYSFLDPKLRNFFIYVFCHSCFLIRVDGAIDYFYTADETCVPDGPHFSYAFYKVWAGIFEFLSALFALWLFYRHVKKWPARYALAVPVFFSMVSGIFDLLVISRTNIRFGFGDKITFIFGDAMIRDICSVLLWLPIVLLISKFSPEDVESSVFALAASTGNFGGQMASVFGSSLLKTFGVRTEAGDCDFSNLPRLLVITRFVIPWLVILLSFILVPNIHLYDISANNSMDVELAPLAKRPKDSTRSDDSSDPK